MENNNILEEQEDFELPPNPPRLVRQDAFIAEEEENGDVDAMEVDAMEVDELQQGGRRRRRRTHRHSKRRSRKTRRSRKSRKTRRSRRNRKY
jgi:hypothetical protein